MRFQIVWLILRSVFCHKAEGPNKLNFPILHAEKVGLRTESVKKVLDLMFALQDIKCMFTRKGIIHITTCYGWKRLRTSSDQNLQLQETFPVNMLSGNERKFQIAFRGVVGDILLTSAA